MYTDINRLHDVLEGRLSGRGCGRTFSELHIMVGYIEVGVKDIVCLVDKYYVADQYYVHDMATNVFRDHKLMFKYNRQDHILHSIKHSFHDALPTYERITYNFQNPYKQTTVKFIVPDKNNSNVFDFTKGKECQIIDMRD
jgi:hypothetical protein